MWNAELQVPYGFPFSWFIFLGSGPQYVSGKALAAGTPRLAPRRSQFRSQFRN